MKEQTLSLSNEKVFLSYSHNDSELVERIAEKISNQGFSCWIDKNKLRANENFNVAIDYAIDGAIVFIAFISKTYVNKPYCIHEFDRAIDMKKSIMVVCIDDVNEATNRQFSYVFSFSAGHNILGFNCGVENNESALETFANDIVNSIPMQMLKRYSITGDENDYPPISMPDYFIASLRKYHEKQYVQNGNYALSQIRKELFPAIKDTEINVLYKDDDNNNVSLVSFFESQCKQEENHKHILITGEGGMGKTVALLNTCEYLLSKKINAIYVPLSKIDADMTLDQYLERCVCGGNQSMWGDLKQLMSAPYKDIPNVVLLLDGINEIPTSYMETFVKGQVKEHYINSYNGIKVIMSSRWFNSSLMHGIKDSVVSLEMQALNKDVIDLYLQSMNLPLVSDESILSVIRTPLMLTLFADVESHKDKYKNMKGIVLEDNPNTAGKILSNFFQTQLYRASEECNFNQREHLTLLEYILPKVAFDMVKRQSQYITGEKFDDYICDMKENERRFTWYLNDRLDRVCHPTPISIKSLKDTAVKGLHFLNDTDEKYEFLHQSFRDYFAAYFIANEMWAYKKRNSRWSEEESIIGGELFDNDILSFVSDIMREEAACPVKTDGGWEFPGKNSTDPSEKSVAEQLLSLWRNKESQFAQNAVANILNVMKIGRKCNLSWCDFSHLDMRKCWLNKCHFNSWYKEKMYPSIFDGAWLDRENFLTNGHESQIVAIVSDGKSLVCSGDRTGTVKIYSMEKKSWIDTISLRHSTVVDLALNGNGKLLAVMYENTVFCYSIEEHRIVGNPYENTNMTQNFRYVRFSEDDELNISFDLEPLIYYDIKNNKITPELERDVPAGCAKWNPVKKEFMRSKIFQMLSIVCFNENTSSWELHPVLKRKQKNYNQFNSSRRNERITKYLELRNLGVTGASCIECIQYNKDGSKVLVIIQNFLFEFDTENYDIINKKKFTYNIHCADYLDNGIVVGGGINVIFLDSDFSENNILQGTQIKTIRTVIEDIEGKFYYVFSSNGEIKKVNNELIVQKIRYKSIKGSVIWARDRLTEDIQMAFSSIKNFPFGARYNYETDNIEPLGWRYELIELYFDDTDEHRFYKADSSLIIVERFPPYKTMLYTNYTGIYIFGCSFKDIHGNISKDENSKFLIQNGGTINE